MNVQGFWSERRFCWFQVIFSQASLWDSGGICRACALCCNVFLYLYSRVSGSIDQNRVEILKLFFGIHGVWCVIGVLEREVAPIRYAFVLSDLRL
jgi:hypothetical protein